MSEIDSIQKTLKQQGISQWDVYVETAEEYEVQLRNFDVETVRGPITNSGYAVRVMVPKNKKVGIGIGTGNSLEPSQVKKCLDTAAVGARVTEFPGYAIPKPSKYADVKVADSKITSAPETVVKEKTEELVALLRKSRTVTPTFGKLRTYNLSTMIGNSEGLRAEKKETFFFVELALKAEQEGKLAEYWPVIFVRRLEDLKLSDQIPNWT